MPRSSRPRSPLSDGYPVNPDAITVFLGQLGQRNARVANDFQDALIKTFNTPEGLMTLELLEKAVLLSAPPAGCDDRALRELHGQRILVAEIRRYAIHGRSD